jgi:hypothetical protein
MTFAATLIGVVIILQGLVGLIAPESFAQLIGAIQVPPVIYAAALVRAVFGVVLLRVAPQSRAPLLLKALGVLVLVGGLLTPIVGVQFGKVILGWWSESMLVVRAFATAALVIGSVIVFATTRRRSAA